MITKNTNVKINVNDPKHSVAMLVQIANQFESTINIVYKNAKSNCKSIMGMLAIELEKGSNITIETNGLDENDALDSIEKYLTGNANV